MKKLFILATMLMMCIIACSACSKKSLPQEPVSECDGGSCPLTNPNITVVSEENWTFSLNGSGWVKKDSPSESIKEVLENQSKDTKVLFVKDFAKDNAKNDFVVYVLGSLRALVSAGLQVKQAVPITINGLPFLQARLVRPGTNIVIWAWLTLKDTYGYGLLCGGEVESATDGGLDLSVKTCFEIINTLHIN